MTPQDCPTKKRWVLFWLALTILVNAVFDVLIGLPYRDPDFAIFATTGLAAFFAYAWVRYDAIERDIDLKAWGAFIAILTKFALPAYFIISRGWKRGLWSCVLTSLLLAGLLVLYGAAALATEHLITVGGS